MKKQKYLSMYKGLPLVDASDDLEIEISKLDVKGARRNSPHACAAAKALERVLQTDAEVHISRTYIKDNKKKQWIRFVTPPSIAREITSFDRSSIFEAGKYHLKAPSNSMKLGEPRRGGTKTDNPKKKKSSRHITVNIRESAK